MARPAHRPARTRLVTGRGRRAPQLVLRGRLLQRQDLQAFGFAKGLEVLVAAIGVGILGTPAAVLVCRLPQEGLGSYVQSAEIVAEFCDEASR
jgi:hypothetical protein